MKLEYPVKANIEIGGVLIGVAYGSMSLDELEQWGDIDKKASELKILDYKVEVLKIFASRLPNSPISDIDFKKVPLGLIDDAYGICIKEMMKWEEPIEVIEEPAQKKRQTGKKSITDSTNTTPISGIDIDLDVPQST